MGKSQTCPASYGAAVTFLRGELLVVYGTLIVSLGLASRAASPAPAAWTGNGRRG
jgi:hypothetical protein